jgi:hypothetical protein
VTFTYERTDNDSTTAYDGGGELAISPKGAKLLLFSDSACTVPVPVADGLAST